MIKINNLTKKYKDKLAVDNLNLEITSIFGIPTFNL